MSLDDCAALAAVKQHFIWSVHARYHGYEYRTSANLKWSFSRQTEPKHAIIRGGRSWSWPSQAARAVCTFSCTVYRSLRADDCSGKYLLFDWFPAIACRIDVIYLFIYLLIGVKREEESGAQVKRFIPLVWKTPKNSNDACSASPFMCFFFANGKNS